MPVSFGIVSLLPSGTLTIAHYYLLRCLLNCPLRRMLLLNDSSPYE